MHFSFPLTGASGRVVFTNLPPRRYTLRVKAQNVDEPHAIIRRRLQISSDPQFCTLHLINSGITVDSTQKTAVLEFVKNGPVMYFNCTLDMQTPFQCKATESVHVYTLLVERMNRY